MDTIQGRVPASPLDQDVVAFVEMFGLKSSPIFLSYEDCGYEREWCHVSAKHRALRHGGRRVHGWALWQYDELLLGDHHSVWETREGKLVDVTPPRFGANRILFVRDDAATIEEENGNYMLFVNRSSLRKFPFFWQGKPTEYTIWPCPPDKTDLVAYCTRLQIPVSAIITDAVTG